MRVVVQNGSNVSLSRGKAEAVVGLFPDTLNRVADKLLLSRSTASEFRVSFHPKERVIALSWPNQGATQPDNSFVLTELITSLAVISEMGGLPRKMSASVTQLLREAHAGTISMAIACAAD